MIHHAPDKEKPGSPTAKGAGLVDAGDRAPGLGYRLEADSMRM